MFNLLIYLIVLALIVNTRSWLLILFFVVTTLQFIPIFSLSNASEVIFWLRGPYTFASEDPVVKGVEMVFYFKIAGFFIISVLYRSNRKEVYKYKEALLFESVKEVPPKLFAQFSILLAAFFIIFWFVSASASSVLAGIDLIIPLLLTIPVLYSLIKKNSKTLIASLIGLVAYAYLQSQSGDRDFVNVLVAFFVYILTVLPVDKRKVFVLMAIFLMTVIVGVYIAINRAGQVITYDIFMQYLYYNSWTAILRPLIDLIRFESVNPNLLYGETYWALLLSFAPSPVYTLLGIEKPFVDVNPAFWYHVPGGGGMHIAGVALKNFGLIGVFLQTLILACLCVLLEKLLRLRNTFMMHLLFVLMASSMMRTVWYSLLSMTNTLFLFLMLVVLVYLFRRLAASTSTYRKATTMPYR